MNNSSFDSAETADITPGPWSVSEENCGGGLNIVGPDGMRVAYTGEHHDNAGNVIYPAEAKANAMLIAEAPAMRDALRYYAAIKGPVGEPARVALKERTE